MILSQRGECNRKQASGRWIAVQADQPASTKQPSIRGGSPARAVIPKLENTIAMPAIIRERRAGTGFAGESSV